MSTKSQAASILQKTFIQSPLSILDPKEVVQVSENTPVAEVIETLHVKNIGCVLVGDNAGKISGIFSERDLVIKQLSCADPRASSPISAFMTAGPQMLKANASVARLLHLMSIGGFRHVPVMPIKDGPLRMLSSTDLFRFIEQRVTSHVIAEDHLLFFDNNALDLFFLSDLSIFKLAPPLVVAANSSPREAAKKMQSAKQSACLIVGPEGQIQGLFTERDYMRKVAINSLPPEKLSMESVMTQKPVTLIGTSSVAFAFSTLVSGGFRNLPIVDSNEKLAGVLSTKHFIDYMAQQIISVLEKARS